LKFGRGEDILVEMVNAILLSFDVCDVNIFRLYLWDIDCKLVCCLISYAE
jgi:hypothetical protein